MRHRWEMKMYTDKSMRCFFFHFQWQWQWKADNKTNGSYVWMMSLRCLQTRATCIPIDFYLTENWVSEFFIVPFLYKKSQAAMWLLNVYFKPIHLYPSKSDNIICVLFWSPWINSLLIYICGWNSYQLYISVVSLLDFIHQNYRTCLFPFVTFFMHNSKFKLNKQYMK